MNRTCPACSARLDQQAPTCPQCGANLAASGTNGAVDQAVRNTAVVAHLSTFAGLVLPFGSVIGPLAVWLTRRNEDPFIDDAGREALNFGISIAIYGLVMLVAALMLIGIPFLMVGSPLTPGQGVRRTVRRCPWPRPSRCPWPAAARRWSRPVQCVSTVPTRHYTILAARRIPAQPGRRPAVDDATRPEARARP